MVSLKILASLSFPPPEWDGRENQNNKGKKICGLR